MKKTLICRLLAGATLVSGVALLSGCVVAPVGYGYDAYGNAYPAYPSTYGSGYGYGYAAPAPVVVQPSIGIGLNYSRGYYGGGERGYWGHRGYGDHYWRR